MIKANAFEVAIQPAITILLRTNGAVCGYYRSALLNKRPSHLDAQPAGTPIGRVRFHTEDITTFLSLLILHQHAFLHNMRLSISPTFSLCFQVRGIYEP